MTKYDIYLIWGKDCDGNILRYYGSTANFIKRKSQHKTNYERWVKNGRPNIKRCASVLILDNGDWKMEKIDEIEGERWEAKKKEGEYQKNNDCVNFKIASRTVKEYRDDNKDVISEKAKQYYINNKDKKKQYQIDNKDKLAEYLKQYYIDNKNKLLEKKKEKIICECGTESTKNSISQHRKTKKHINLLFNNELNV